MDKVKSYQELKIWQKGMALTVEIYKICENYTICQRTKKKVKRFGSGL
ncbi:MAG: hypothetical protein AB1349_00135 [Elusimicrobiota bacterium]